MTTGQLVLIIGLVVIAVVSVAVILRRGSQQRQERRVEAERLRSEAREMAATLSGQSAFAEQAEERAGVARSEADEKVREAERLEAEAAQQQRTAEGARQQYESTMRLADDLDPDVKESQYPPAREDAEPASEEERAHGEPADSPAASAAAPDAPADDEGLPMTRAERRRAREQAEAGEGQESSRSSGPAAPVAGAAGAAAVGATLWASREDDGVTDAEREQSARIASASDYRDDVDEIGPRDATGGPHEATDADGAHGTESGATGDEEEVSSAPPVGTDTGMSQSTRDDAPATTDGRTHGDAAGDAAADAGSPTGEWGGPREGGLAGASGDGSASTEEDTTMTETSHPGESPDTGRAPAEETGGAGTEAVILADTDAYASREPELADGSHAEARDEAGAIRADEPGAGDGVAGDADEPEARDWGHDEGDLLEENRERGEQLAADREALDHEAEGEQQVAAQEPVQEEPVEEQATEAPRGRRVSDFDEIRDGGFGVGSAAPLEDGGQPMGHPVAAYRDTMSFRTPGDPGYDETDPDVWFYDEAAAERSGFHRADG